MSSRSLIPVALVLCLACSLPAPAPELDAAVETAQLDPAVKALVGAALERTRQAVRYDGRYLSLEYPGGDPPPGVGVCTDVVIRSFRAGLGVDLQVEVHEDMLSDFAAFPALWGLSRPDSNIDHRRVPNLETFLARRGAQLPLEDDPATYLPGDLVTWRLPGNLPHIGIVVDSRSSDGERPLIVHNVGSGPRLEDVLFAYERRGHYRYLPGVD